MIKSIKRCKGVIHFCVLCFFVASYISVKTSMNLNIWNNNELIVLLIILGSFNMHKIGNIFNAKKEPKIFWTNQTFMTRYILIVFFKSFGIQLLIATLWLVILILFKMISINYFILSLLYLLIMNFGFSLTKIYLYIFSIITVAFPFFLISDISWFRGVKEVVLYLLIISMYVLFFLYFISFNISWSNNDRHYSSHFAFESIGQNKILLEKSVRYRFEIVMIAIMDVIIISISSEFSVIHFLSPGSLIVIVSITIFEAIVGNSLDGLDLDKHRMKSLLSNTNLHFFTRFRSSTIYFWYVLLAVNIFLSSILQVILTKEFFSVITIIYIPCLLTISMIYYRKSELIVIRSNVKIKFIIFIAYMIAITGGIIVEIYT